MIAIRQENRKVFYRGGTFTLKVCGKCGSKRTMPREARVCGICREVRM